jgi:GMP synthase (glutamine-hydrolysing)
VRRQPFPGPGLAVRIIGEVTEDKLLECAGRLQPSLEEEVSAAGLGDEIWQCFAVVGDDMATGGEG